MKWKIVYYEEEFFIPFPQLQMNMREYAYYNQR